MKTRKIPALRWRDLSISQANEIKSLVSKHLPYMEFDFEGNRIFKRGASGSDADFTEIGVETLFELVAKVLYRRE